MIRETIETECDLCGWVDVTKLVGGKEAGQKKKRMIRTMRITIGATDLSGRLSTTEDVVSGEVCSQCEDVITRAVVAAAKAAASMLKAKGKQQRKKGGKR